MRCLMSPRRSAARCPLLAHRGAEQQGRVHAGGQVDARRSASSRAPARRPRARLPGGPGRALSRRPHRLADRRGDRARPADRGRQGRCARGWPVSGPHTALSAGYRDDPLQRPPRSSVLAARTSRLSACCPGPGSGATCPDAGGSWRFAGHAGASGARVVEPHPPR